MNKFFLTILTIIVVNATTYAQIFNWANLQPTQKNLLTARYGLDYGMTAGIGYGRHIPGVIPTILQAEFSTPAGDFYFDDMKTIVGVQMRLLKTNRFLLSGELNGVFRRYESDNVRLVNFGSSAKGRWGYYGQHFFVAAEFGFDKAIVTHFKHGYAYTSSFPEVQDGWYEPSTGGNYNYGLFLGTSFGKHDIYLKAGRLISQGFDNTPLLSFYGELGYSIRLKSSSKKQSSVSVH